MRISKKSEYALRALLVFTRRPRNYQVQELSLQENIPVKFLEQILAALKRAGILSSKRGTGGGYLLRADPALLSVGEVIEIMDGPLAPVACAAPDSTERCSCPEPRNCALRLLMSEVRQELSGTLKARTLADMAALGTHGGELAFEI